MPIIYFSAQRERANDLNPCLFEFHPSDVANFDNGSSGGAAYMMEGFVWNCIYDKGV